MKKLLFGFCCLGVAAAEPAPDPAAAIHWVQQNGAALVELPFPLVIESATGKKVFPVNLQTDQAWLETLGRVLDRSLVRLNEPNHPIHRVARINEASRFIEDEIRRQVNLLPGWKCTIPPTAGGRELRSGYPELRAVSDTGVAMYLDPKLYAAESVIFSGASTSDFTRVDLDYTGEEPVGFEFRLTASSSIQIVTVNNLRPDNSELEFSWLNSVKPILATGQLIVRTVSGSKGVSRVDDGVVSSAMSSMYTASRFFDLLPGINSFAVLTDPTPGHLYEIEYRPAYGGL